MDINVPDTRTVFTRALREIADFLDGHPEVPLPYLGSSVHTGGKFVPALSIYLSGTGQRDQIAAIARAFGRAEKSVHERTGQFYAYRTFGGPGGIDLVAAADRDEVCERVVTATREVEVEEPDPEALAAVPKVKRTEVIEDVEWVCRPLLRERGPVAELAEAAVS